MRTLWYTACLCISALAAGVFGTALPASAGEAESNYIVQVAPGTQEIVTSQIENIGGVVTAVLDEALDGLVVTLSEAEAAQAAEVTSASSISPTVPVQLMTTQDTSGGTGYTMWNLSRLDQATLPVDTSYTYPSSAGSGVLIYVVDSGITASNPDFAGRVAAGRNFASDRPTNDTGDCNGHGTHVAGVVGSQTFGVAKNATLIPVRVFDCAGSSDSGQLLEALDWIMSDMANRPAGTRAVVNMSLGVVNEARAPSRNFTLDSAVQALTAQNIVVAVAAGNANADACAGSPGAVSSALTVGATTDTDGRASFSNYGSCLDLFAPGEVIWSLKWDDQTRVSGYSGTSQAAPHVAGIAALALSLNPSLTVAQVSSQIINNAAIGQVSNAGPVSPNRLANVSWLNASSPTVSPTPTPTSGSGSVAGTNPNFVRNLYRDFLSRTASVDEVNYWTGELNSGRATQASLTTILSTSDEWIRVVIRGFYVDTLGREPDAAGYQYWIDRARGGEPIADIGAFFYGSDEYFNGFGNGNNRTWISDLYTKLMLRSADSGGLNYWLGQLNSGMSRTAVSRWFYQSPEKLGLRVDALYSKLLGRGSDPGGRIYWSGVLATAGDLRLASFLASSPEYFGRKFGG